MILTNSHPQTRQEMRSEAMGGNACVTPCERIMITNHEMKNGARQMADGRARRVSNPNTQNNQQASTKTAQRTRDRAEPWGRSHSSLSFTNRERESAHARVSLVCQKRTCNVQRRARPTSIQRRPRNEKTLTKHTNKFSQQGDLLRQIRARKIQRKSRTLQ